MNSRRAIVGLINHSCLRVHLHYFTSTILADLKREVVFLLMGVPALEAEFTDVDLKDALRVCLVMAAEESFQREIKAL